MLTSQARHIKSKIHKCGISEQLFKSFDDITKIKLTHYQPHSLVIWFLQRVSLISLLRMLTKWPKVFLMSNSFKQLLLGITQFLMSLLHFHRMTYLSSVDLSVQSLMYYQQMLSNQSGRWLYLTLQSCLIYRSVKEFSPLDSSCHWFNPYSKTPQWILTP